MTPYYADDLVTLYHGDVRDAVPDGLNPDVTIADPPYAQTSLAWDRWVDGWPTAIPGRSMWCFGTLRLFMDRAAEFAAGGWRLSQDVIWEKHNGSNLHADRFRRVHEQVAHFYRGDWSAVHKAPPHTNDATARTIRAKFRAPHFNDYKPVPYESHDGGPRLMRSVIAVRSTHGYAENETQKPVGIIAPLIEYGCPSGGLVFDPFSGAGSTSARTSARSQPAAALRKCWGWAHDRLGVLGAGSAVGRRADRRGVVVMHLRGWRELSPEERHRRTEELLGAKRPRPNTPAWTRRETDLMLARIDATPEDRERLHAESSAMWQERNEADRRRDARQRPFREADRVSMNDCPMRASSVRGLDPQETAKRRLCWLDGKPLPERRQRWCSDACVKLWTDNHEWSAASFAVVKRDPACVQCGSANRPEVNHRDPRIGRGYHQGCHHHLDGLERLCHTCHVAETTRQARERRAAS